MHGNAGYEYATSWDGDDDGMNCALDSLNDAIDGLFFKTTVNPNNPNVQQVRGQNIIANEIAGETIHPGGAEAYAMTEGLVSALPGVGMIMDLEELTDTNNSVSTRVMAGMSLGVMGVLSSAAAAEGRMCNLFCFTEGTQIVVGEEFTEDNVFVEYVTVDIEDIAVGDLVYSYDTVTGTVTQQEVTTTFAREADHLNYLTIVDENGESQIIETTDSHPFWVVTDEPDLERAARSVVDENGITLYHENLESNLNGFWVEAKDLQVDDVFLGANGELSALVTSERVEFPDGVKVYNFTVEGNHDYFVIAETDEYGQTCILVHNGICDVPFVDPNKGKIHNIDVYPNEVPKDWTKDELIDARDALIVSTRNRQKAFQEHLYSERNAHDGHGKRLEMELDFLAKVRNRLREFGIYD